MKGVLSSNRFEISIRLHISNLSMVISLCLFTLLTRTDIPKRTESQTGLADRFEISTRTENSVCTCVFF